MENLITTCCWCDLSKSVENSFQSDLQKLFKLQKFKLVYMHLKHDKKSLRVIILTIANILEKVQHVKQFFFTVYLKLVSAAYLEQIEEFRLVSHLFACGLLKVVTKQNLHNTTQLLHQPYSYTSSHPCVHPVLPTW